MFGAGLGDGIDVGIIPVVLGGGIPRFCLHRQNRARLKLTKQRVYRSRGSSAWNYDGGARPARQGVSGQPGAVRVMRNGAEYRPSCDRNDFPWMRTMVLNSA